MDKKTDYKVALSFEEIALPPVNDILVLGRRCPQGKHGVSKCFNLLSPDKFELIEIDAENVQAILVSKKILKRMPSEKIIEILAENVFPYVSNGESVKVDFNVKIFIDNIKGKL